MNISVAKRKFTDWMNLIYAKIWYNTQSLWIKSGKLRRPFTFMMRDFVIRHRVLGSIIIVIEIVGLAFLVRWNWIAGGLAIAVYFMVAGHLWWGTPVKLGEQEEPEYTEGGETDED